MATSWLSQYVGCPFYKENEGHAVKCEGIVDGATTRHQFGTKADFEQHMSIFCCKNYICCEWYRTLMNAKYDDE